MFVVVCHVAVLESLTRHVQMTQKFDEQLEKLRAELRDIQHRNQSVEEQLTQLRAQIAQGSPTRKKSKRYVLVPWPCSVQPSHLGGLCALALLSITK